MFLKFFHVVACISTSFLVLPNDTPMCRYTIFLFIHLSIDGIWIFPFFFIINNAVMNNCINVFAWTCVLNSLEYKPGNGIAGSYNSMFNILRNCQTVSQGNFMILHSYQQYISTLISTHPVDTYYCLSFFSFILFQFWSFPGQDSGNEMFLPNCKLMEVLWACLRQSRLSQEVR